MPLGTDRRARFRVGRVFLADMNAVAAQFRGEVGPVVENEGRACRLHDRAQQIGGAADGVVIDILQAQLKAGDIAAVQRFAQGMMKFFADRCGGEIR